MKVQHKLRGSNAFCWQEWGSQHYRIPSWPSREGSWLQRLKPGAQRISAFSALQCLPLKGWVLSSVPLLTLNPRHFSFPVARLTPEIHKMHGFFTSWWHLPWLLGLGDVFCGVTTFCTLVTTVFSHSNWVSLLCIYLPLLGDCEPLERRKNGHRYLWRSRISLFSVSEFK